MSLSRTLSVIAAVLALAVGTASAQAPFSKLPAPQPTEGGGKIEVIEFFWYGCPHCYALEPSVAAWIKNAPKDVVFRRIPAYPSESWGEMARVFYTLEAMGLLEKYHQKVFDAMHRDGVNLANKRLREEWLAKNGIDVPKYNDVEKSFAVSTKLSRARQLTLAYQVDSVPRLIVNGKYFTSAEQAGAPDKVFSVVDQIIAVVRKEKG
jgi:thiol:disulfide interchange protein DsbA